MVFINCFYDSYYISRRFLNMLKINHSKGTEQKIKTTIDNITLLKKSYSFIS